MNKEQFLKEAMEALAPIVKKHFPKDNYWSFYTWIKQDGEGKVYIDGVGYNGDTVTAQKEGKNE